MKIINELEPTEKIAKGTHANMQDINNELAARKVNPFLHCHWMFGGIEGLITYILNEREASYPAEIVNSETGQMAAPEHTPLRNIVVGTAMFTQQIKDRADELFTDGGIRYPLETIETYLSVFMTRKGKIKKIRLTNAEDKPRPKKNSKPRAKWYLIKQ